MSKWRDRLSDAAVAASESHLCRDFPRLYDWEESHGFDDGKNTTLFDYDDIVRARVYDSLSCDGLGVDELDDEPVMSERREL